MIKPCKVVAKITRVVTEVAIVYLNRNGNVEEHEETITELDSHSYSIEHIRQELTWFED
jgi:hypothetical protein